MKTETSLFSFLSLTFASALLAGNVAVENPQVISGQVTFEGLQSDQALITQQSDKAIVDYQRFDLMAGGSVHFDLPSEQAAILNRIIGADPSTLNGSITGNGQIYFVNPAGVTFGPDSVVRADTFMAIAGQILNEDFLGDQLNFELSGEVRNFGLIEALNDVGLIGESVVNAGDIVSKSGVSILAAGDKVMLRANGSSLAVELSSLEVPVQDGVALENTGNVSGDEVMFSSGDAYSVALSNSGSVSAKSSAKLYSDGGRIDVSGEVLTADAGRIEIGGTDKGGAGSPVASELNITETARIDASATTEGDGGHVVLYSKGKTSMTGTVTALGSGEGQGGYVEISGAELDVKTSIENVQIGRGGSLLIDPTDVTIDQATADGYETQLRAGANVTVETLPGDAGTDAGDITLEGSLDNFSFNDVGTFTLNSTGSIIIDAILDNGDGSIIMNAEDSITLNDQVLTGNVGAGATIELLANTGTVTFDGTGAISIFGDTNAKINAQRLVNNIGAGAINLNGTGFWQVVLPHWAKMTGDNPTGNVYGGLTSGNKAVFGSSGTALSEISQKEYHFVAAPELGITVNDDSKTYGEAPNSITYTDFTVDAATLVDAADLGGIFTQDSRENTIDESAIVYSTAGSPTTANAGAYNDLTISGQTSLNGYTFDVTPGTYTVNQRAIEVTANDRSRIYGDTLDLETSEFTYVDSFDGDTVLPNGEVLTTVVLGSATDVDYTTTTDVGVYVEEVTVGALSGTGGFDSDNYALTAVSGDLEVLVRPVTVTATEQNKHYGEVIALDGTSIAITDKDGDSNLPHGEDIASAGMTYAFGPDLGASTIASVATTANVIEPTSVTGASGFKVTNYDITFENGDFRIDARPITITANEQSKQYGEVLTLDTTDFTLLDTLTAGSTLPNFELIDTVDVSSLTDIDVNTTAGASTYAAELKIADIGTSSNGFNAANYDITYVTGNLQVNPREITLTANSQARVYGDTLTLAGTEFTLADLDGGDLPNGESIDSVTLTSANDADVTTDLSVGRYADDIYITGQAGSSGFDPANYNISYVEGDFVVNARPITVTALEQDKRYGEAVTLDSTVISIVDKDGGSDLPHGEDIESAVLTWAFGTDLASSTTSPVATTFNAIRPTGVNGVSGFDVSNYEITFGNGDYRIDPRPITVLADGQSKQYGQTLTLDTAAFGVLDNLTSTSTLPNGEMIDAVDLTSLGGIDASTTADAGVYADDISITGIGTASSGFVETNYDITYATGSLTVDAREITLTASEQYRIYGDTMTLDNTAFTVTDLDGGEALPNDEFVDTVTLRSEGGLDTRTDANVGNYTNDLSITGQTGSDGFDAANYSITYVEGDLVVERREISLTANAQEKTYGEAGVLDGTEFTLEDTYGGADLPNGETIDSVDLVSAAGVEATDTDASAYVDDLSITGQSGSSGFLASNYDITYETGDYTINRRAITVDLLNQERFFSEVADLDTTAFTVFDPMSSSAALPNGESIDNVVFSEIGVPGLRALPGLYVDALDAQSLQGSSGFNTANYTISVAPGNLLIKNYPAPAITPAETFPNDQNFVFGGGTTIQLKEGVPAMSANAFPTLLASAAWKSLTRAQQENFLARLGEAEDPEELSEELLEYLLADAKSQ